MKKVIGGILCLVAILAIAGKLIGSQADTQAHNIQDWALIGFVLVIGIALVQGKKKSPDSEKK